MTLEGSDWCGIFWVTCGWLSNYSVGLYRISAPAPAGVKRWHFYQIRQKSGSGKNPTGAR